MEYEDSEDKKVLMRRQVHLRITEDEYDKLHAMYIETCFAAGRLISKSQFMRDRLLDH